MVTCTPPDGTCKTQPPRHTRLALLTHIHGFIHTCGLRVLSISLMSHENKKLNFARL